MNVGRLVVVVNNQKQDIISLNAVEREGRIGLNKFLLSHQQNPHPAHIVKQIKLISKVRSLQCGCGKSIKLCSFKLIYMYICMADTAKGTNMVWITMAGKPPSNR